jgi:hypothetical protein
MGFCCNIEVCSRVVVLEVESKGRVDGIGGKGKEDRSEMGGDMGFILDGKVVLLGWIKERSVELHG